MIPFETIFLVHKIEFHTSHEIAKYDTKHKAHAGNVLSSLVYQYIIDPARIITGRTRKRIKLININSTDFDAFKVSIPKKQNPTP